MFRSRRITDVMRLIEQFRIYPIALDSAVGHTRTCALIARHVEM